MIEKFEQVETEPQAAGRPITLTVKLTDDEGQPGTGCKIKFRCQKEKGVIGKPECLTDEDGIASVDVVPQVPGILRVYASGSTVDGPKESVQFEINVVSAPEMPATTEPAEMTTAVEEETERRSDGDGEPVVEQPVKPTVATPDGEKPGVPRATTGESTETPAATDELPVKETVTPDEPGVAPPASQPTEEVATSNPPAEAATPAEAESPTPLTNQDPDKALDELEKVLNELATEETDEPTPVETDEPAGLESKPKRFLTTAAIVLFSLVVVCLILYGVFKRPVTDVAPTKASVIDCSGQTPEIVSSTDGVKFVYHNCKKR